MLEGPKRRETNHVLNQTGLRKEGTKIRSEKQMPYSRDLTMMGKKKGERGKKEAASSYISPGCQEIPPRPDRSMMP